MGSSVIPWAEWRFARWVALLVIVHLTCGLGCAAPSGEALDVDTLEAQFEQRARAVLRGDDALVPTDGGFELAPRPSRAGAALAFSSDGSSAARFDLPDGLGIVEEARSPLLVDPSWNVTAASDATLRAQHTATLLPDGRVLIAGGVSAADRRTHLASAAIYDPALDAWLPAAPMSEERSVHTATLLADGRVLVTGGASGGAEWVSSAELYDPATDAWTPATTMISARSSHTATLLADGRVLAAGGAPPGGAPGATAELYDPVSDTWSPTPAASVARRGHAATRLRDGRVLLVGGRVIETGVLSSVDIYDPTTGAWTPGPDMLRARWMPTATLLEDGDVLVIGYDREGEAETYDPEANAWTLASNKMSSPRVSNTATRLCDGRVLVSDNLPPDLYDPSTRTFSRAPRSEVSRSDATATLLPDGRVLFVGGHSSTVGADIYDPSVAPSGTQLGPLNTLRYFVKVVELADGKVLIAGNGVATTEVAELFDPSSRTFSVAAPSNLKRYRPELARLADGRVLLSGGLLDDSAADLYNEIYDPAGDAWTLAAPDEERRYNHTATLLGSGEVLIAGGEVWDYPMEPYLVRRTGSAGLYRPADDTWVAVEPMNAPRAEHAATLLNDGRVLVVGGIQGEDDYNTEYSTAEPLASAEIYDPATRRWSLVAPMAEPRDRPTATRLLDGRVLVVGGAAEVYDPMTNAWTPTGPMSPMLAFNHVAMLVPTGEVLVIGGTTAQIYSPATNSWTPAPSPLLSYGSLSSVLLPSGDVLLVGWSSYAELYDPRWHSPGDNGCSTGAGGEGGAGGGESGAGGVGGSEPGTGGAGGAGGEESVTGGAGSGGSGTGSVGGAGGGASGTGGMGGEGAGAGGAGGSWMATAAGAGGDGSPGPTSTSSGPGAGEPPTEAGCSMAQGAPGGGPSAFYLAVAVTALRRRLRRSRAAIPR